MFSLLCLLLAVSADTHIPRGSKLSALIIVGVQECHLSGESYVVPIVNQVRDNDFDMVIWVKEDWCDTQVHFGTGIISLDYDAQGDLCTTACTAAYSFDQTRTAAYCVSGSPGTAYVEIVKRAGDQEIVIGGASNCDYVPGSAFLYKGGFKSTDLAAMLELNGIDTIYLAGHEPAFLDKTASEAASSGYITYVIEDAVASLAAKATLETDGVEFIFSAEIPSILDSSIKPRVPRGSKRSALIIVDVQNCFVPGGSLPVAGGDEVIPIINRIREVNKGKFDVVVRSLDWHCPDHVSFASQHTGASPYTSVVELDYNARGSLCSAATVEGNYTVDCFPADIVSNVSQTLWPDHCIKGSADAAEHADLVTEASDYVMHQGFHCYIDSYSTFYDNGGFSQTGLHSYLVSENIDSVYIVGLALDYVVSFSAIDAARLGYHTFVVKDATRSVAESTGLVALERMEAEGVQIINEADVKSILDLTHVERVPRGQRKAALLILDIQGCFLEGGALAVPNADEVIPVINSIRTDNGDLFTTVVRSQDWHCADHVSFASQHPGRSMFDVVELSYSTNGSLCESNDVIADYTVPCETGSTYTVNQTLWPDHCVKGTAGAKEPTTLDTDASDYILKQGGHCYIDSYSAFFDNGGFSQTALHNYLGSLDVDTVFIAGIATDYVVSYTALDAADLGYVAYVVEDGCRGIAAESVSAQEEAMQNAGVEIIHSSEIRGILDATYVPAVPTPEKKRSALLIVDVQNCFLPGGALAVDKGDEVIPVINDLRAAHDWDVVVRSMDWHCEDHVSFASQHPGKELFATVELDYDARGSLCHTANVLGDYTVQCDLNAPVMHKVDQTLWPDHCVKGTQGAEEAVTLVVNDTDYVMHQGFHCYIDSYSIFYDNGGFAQTGLHSYLVSEKIDSVYVVGLATDYVVSFSAVDAAKLGYSTHVVEDACRGIADDTVEAAKARMKDAGVKLVQAAAVDLRAGSTGGGPSPLKDDPLVPILITLGIFMFIALLVVVCCICRRKKGAQVH